MSDHQREVCEACLSEEYESYAHDRIHESMAKNELWLTKYKIHDWPRWDYELLDCTLTFSDSERARVVCDIRAIGSAHGNSWEWAWGNSNFPDECKRGMQEVQEFGEKKEWSKLTSLFLTNDPYLGWELASITSHLLGGEAVYRCPDSENSNNCVYLIVLSSAFVQ